MRRALVVGPGRAGTALALALRGLGYEIAAAGGGARSQERFRALLGREPARDASAAARQADICFLTVPDRQIATLTRDLALRGAFRSGQLVVHLSGTLPVGVLEPARGLGADILAMHPLVAIADPSVGAQAFMGTVCTLEGTPAALERGVDLVHSLGGVPWCVGAAQKTRIHAAAVLSSNALVALLATAAEACDDPADSAILLSALLPLASGALRNIERHGLREALTGPVARGDVETVRRHLMVLSGDAREIYRATLAPLVRIARAQGALTDAAAQDLLLLASEASPGWRDE